MCTNLQLKNINCQYKGVNELVKVIIENIQVLTYEYVTLIIINPITNKNRMYLYMVILNNILILFTKQGHSVL